MKTYEIIFSGICSICKHLKFLGGYSFSCEITKKPCDESNCPVIKKLKEVKNGQAKV